MSDYTELVNALRETSIDFGELDDVSVMLLDAAAAIEHLMRVHWQDEALIEASEETIKHLQAEVKDLNEALKVENNARENAEAKRYCCNCAHMDASMYDEAWYGICKLNDFEVEAIHGWGCTDWAKMEGTDESLGSL